MSKRRVRPSKLKPCPFCGHEILTLDCVKRSDIWVDGEIECSTAIKCPTCKAIGPPGKSWSVAVRRWNKRKQREHLQSVHEVWADVPELIKELNQSKP